MSMTRVKALPLMHLEYISLRSSPAPRIEATGLYSFLVLLNLAIQLQMLMRLLEMYPTFLCNLSRYPLASNPTTGVTTSKNYS